MVEFEKALEAMANRGKLWEAGHDRPYLEEWNAAEYPSKFKVPILHYFDEKGSLTQHLYYFRAKTRNIARKHAVLTWLFVSSLLKG